MTPKQAATGPTQESLDPTPVGDPTPLPPTNPVPIQCVKCRKDGVEYITTYDDCIADGGEIVDKEVPCPQDVLLRLRHPG